MKSFNLAWAYDPTISFSQPMLRGGDRFLVCIENGQPKATGEPSLWDAGHQAWEVLTAKAKGGLLTNEMIIKGVTEAEASLRSLLTELEPLASDGRIVALDGSRIDSLRPFLDDGSLADCALLVYELTSWMDDKGFEGGFKDALDWDTVFGLCVLTAVNDFLIAQVLDGRGAAEAAQQLHRCSAMLDRGKAEERITAKVVRQRQAQAARARHKETNEFKTEILAAWARGDFKTIAAADRWARKTYPIKGESTVRRWITEFRKAKPDGER